MDPLLLGKVGLGRYGMVAGAYLSAQADQQWALANPSSGILKLEHVTRTIGSVVHGLDLSKPLSQDVVDALRHALLLRKVLFFRDQALTTDEHLNLARRFGKLEVHPFTASKEGYDEVLMVDHGRDSPSNENYYHSDVSWRADPSMGSILYCRETPEFGGDTIFVDMYAAYEGLPDDVKERIRGMTATHDWHSFRTLLMANGLWSQEQIRETMEKFPEQHHPVVRTHPETGRDLLYVNPIFTKSLDGVSAQESDELLQRLYQQAPAPEYQVRFSWKAGSVAFWDNRAVQHYAVADYWPHRRVMERVTILGDRPFHRDQAKL